MFSAFSFAFADFRSGEILSGLTSNSWLSERLLFTLSFDLLVVTLSIDILVETCFDFLLVTLSLDILVADFRVPSFSIDLLVTISDDFLVASLLRRVVTFS